MKSNSRTKKSLINIIVSLSSNSVSIIIGLVAQAIFIKILGSEYLGLNGLFTNIISMLAIAELGIGSAIIYNLYKPIAENDIECIKSLMKFYRKSYHIIGIIVAIIGLAIVPFLKYITGTVTLSVNINLIYLLFLTDIVISYFFSYKRSILYANQSDYIVKLIHVFYLFGVNIFQLLVLYATKNYYLYLVIKIIMRFIENISITIIANRKYAFLKDKNVKKLSKNIEQDIFKKVKALFLHQIGAFVINGTDNIIISRYIGITAVGLYSSYYLIINSVQTIANQIIDATTPSIGNMLVTDSKEKHFMVFKRMRFLNFWIAVFCGNCIFVLMEPFIKIWIGSNYLLDTSILLVLVINFYQKTSRLTYKAFKTAAGIFYEDRFAPIFEAVINIVVSVLLVKKIGLVGVFIGTIASGLTLWCYSYPKYVYKNLFDRKYKDYIKETLGYILFFLITLFITAFVTNKIVLSNLFVELVVKLIACLIIPNICIMVCFFRTDNFKYYINMIFKIFHKNKRDTKDKVCNLNNESNSSMNEENISFRHNIELDYDYNKSNIKN